MVDPAGASPKSRWREERDLAPRILEFPPSGDAAFPHSGKSRLTRFSKRHLSARRMGFGSLGFGISAVRRIWVLGFGISVVRRRGISAVRRRGMHGAKEASMLIPGTLFESNKTVLRATDYWLCILGDEQLDNCDNLEKLIVGCEIIAALDDINLLAA